MEENPLTPEDASRKLMGEAILLQEKYAYNLHNTQRMSELERAPFHERIASILSTMNGKLSVVDESSETAIAMHTRDLLRNSRVKSELAGFLILQALIQRMSSLTNIVGRTDDLILELLADKDKLNPNQLLALQRSAHAQLGEISEYVRDTRTEGLEGLMKSLVPESNEQVVNTIESFTKLDAKGREKVNVLIRKLMTGAAERTTATPDATAIDVKP